MEIPIAIELIIDGIFAKADRGGRLRAACHQPRPAVRRMVHGHCL
jgi:hypothetical protein